MTQPPSRWFGKFLFAVVCIVGQYDQGGVAQAQECDPLRAQDLQLIVIEAQDFLSQNAPGEALETVTTGESNLLCLTGEIGPGELSSLYQVKAAALYALGGSYRSQSSAIFYHAAAINPDASCTGAGMMRGATSQCKKAAERLRAQGQQSVTLTGYHSGRALYIDGERQEPDIEGNIQAALYVGLHLLQVQTGDGWDNVLLEIEAGGLEYSLEPHLGSRAQLEAVERGSLFLEGLPRDAAVEVDGRARRDLPRISQLEPGEHYIKINSPSMGTMGYSVVIEPGEETVFPVVFEGQNAGRGGVSSLLSQPKLLGTYGASVGFALLSGVSFLVAGNRYDAANAEYATYLDMVAISADGYQDQFDTALAIQQGGNRMLIGGWSCVGMALASATAGTYFLMQGDGGDSFVKQGVALRPSFNAGRAGERELGVNLSLRF